MLLITDKDIWEIIALTMAVTLSSTAIAAILGIPIAVSISISEFKLKKVIIRIINTLMGLPPVVAGLLVYLLISSKGPFGFARMLFTPTAMIIAQVIIITPVIAGLTIGAVTSKYLEIKETCMGLNLNKVLTLRLLVNECKYSLWSTIFAGYGRSISEVGAVMLVGGNIQYKTRVMTTAIVLETGKGEYSKALTLGAMLLIISLIVNSLLHRFQKA